MVLGSKGGLHFLLHQIENVSVGPGATSSPGLPFCGCWTNNRGILPPKWMVKIMENPIKLDDLGVPTPIFGNIPYTRNHHFEVTIKKTPFLKDFCGSHPISGPIANLFFGCDPCFNNCLNNPKILQLWCTPPKKGSSSNHNFSGASC